MPRCCQLFPTLAALFAVLAAASGQQPPSKETPKPAKADPAAEEALGKAVEKLDPKKVGWLETTVWQQLDAQGLSFEAQGQYVVGPDERMNLELHLRVGGTDGSLRVVSDGKTLWEVTRVGDQDPQVAKVELARVLNVLDAPSLLQTREQFLRDQSFAGLLPLLSSLRKQMTFTRKQTVSWRGKEVILLTGTWTGADPESKQWPDSFPRRCRLFLDRESYWPHRLEWWGPSAGRRDDVILMQLEFRNPQHPQQVPASKFAFSPPPKAKVEDRTAMLEASARHMARLTPPSRPAGGTPR